MIDSSTQKPDEHLLNFLSNFKSGDIVSLENLWNAITGAALSLEKEKDAFCREVFYLYDDELYSHKFLETDLVMILGHMEKFGIRVLPLGTDQILWARLL